MQGCIETSVEEYLHKFNRYIHKAAPFGVKDITGERVLQVFQRTKESAGGMDGWSPKELSLLPIGACNKIAIMFNQIENGAP